MSVPGLLGVFKSLKRAEDVGVDHGNEREWLGSGAGLVVSRHVLGRTIFVAG